MPPRHATADRDNAERRRFAFVRGHSLLLAAGVILLVFLVALGSSRSLAHFGSGNLRHAREISAGLFVLLFAIAVALTTVFAAWRILSDVLDEADVPGKEKRSTSHRLLVQMVVLLSLAAIALAIALGRPRDHTKGPTQRPSSGGLPRDTQSKTTGERVAAELAPWVIGAVLVVLVAVLIVAIVIRRRRNSEFEAEPLETELEQQRQELRTAVESSLADVESEPDPRRAVIRAYTEMEGVLALHGLARRRAEAPREYLARAFAAVRVSHGAAERLTRLFERARFSEHAIGSGMKREAIAALAEVRDELRTESG